MKSKVPKQFSGRGLTCVFDTAKGCEGRWRIRGSGVFGWPDQCEQTAAIAAACEELGIRVIRKSGGSPGNANSYTLEAPFLDGGLQAKTGNYWYERRGAWIVGARALLLVALALKLSVSPQWLRQHGVEGETIESLKFKLDVVVPLTEKFGNRLVIRTESRE
jgi:hypothetical protein